MWHIWFHSFFTHPGLISVQFDKTKGAQREHFDLAATRSCGLNGSDCTLFFFFSVVQVTVTTKRVLVKGTQLQQFQSQTLKINRLVASECSVKTHAIHQCHSSGQIGSIFPAVLLVSQKEKHRNNREAVILLSSGGKVPTWKPCSGEIFWRICCLKQVNNVE